MTWIASPVSPDDVTAEFLYEIGKKHRLVPDNVTNAIDYYNRVSQNCVVITVNDVEDIVGYLIITDINDGENANVDFIPNTKFFAPGEEYHDNIYDAVHPIMVKLMEGRHLRRVTSMVPQTRCRTKKALKACGFKVEGVMRDAIKFKGKEPESITIMGILPTKE